MQGILEFASLADAIRAGYQVYDRSPDGFIVRIKQAGGWAMALVRPILPERNDRGER